VFGAVCPGSVGPLVMLVKLVEAPPGKELID